MKLNTAFKILLILALWLVGHHSVFAATTYETRKELSDFARAAFLSEESATPSFLWVPEVSDSEQEAIFNSIRERLDKPLSLWEVTLLNYPRLRLLRNEIYARHGMKFTSVDLDTWFRSFSWYREDPTFTEQKLSKTEQANAAILKKLEYVKYHRLKDLCTYLDPPGVAIKTVKGKNSHISVANRNMTVLKTGKTLKLAYKESRDSNKQLAFTNFESAGMFDNLPLIFVQTWRTEHQVSGATEPVGLRVYDLEGNEVKSFPDVAGSLYYNKQLNSFVSHREGGCCGVSKGSSVILDTHGTLKFLSAFGSEGIANGSLGYVKPLWGDSIIAYVSNEIRQPSQSNADMNKLRIFDRFAVLGKSGESIIDMALPTETFERLGRLNHLVQLTPEVLYVMGGERIEDQQVLIYLNKTLPQKSSIGILYRWAPQEVASANNQIRPALSPKLQVIRNPAVLWSINKQKFVDTAFGAKEVYTLVEGSEDANAVFSAYDKLSGQQLFTYQLPDTKQGHYTYAVTSNRLFYLRHSEHPALHLYELTSGKAVANTILKKLEPGYRHASKRRLFAIDNGRVLLFSILETGYSGSRSDKSFIVLLEAFDDSGKKLWEHQSPLNTAAKKQTYYLGHTAAKIYYFDGEKTIFLNPDDGKPLTDDVMKKPDDTVFDWRQPAPANMLRWKLDDGDIDSFERENSWRVGERSSCSSSPGKDAIVYLGGNRVEAINACDYYTTTHAPDLQNGDRNKKKKKEVFELKREWSIFPKINEDNKSEHGDFKVLHVDNNYLFVDGGDRFWAIGEEALKDYLQRAKELIKLSQ